jgi:hypothetical protein
VYREEVYRSDLTVFIQFDQEFISGENRPSPSSPVSLTSGVMKKEDGQV